MKNSKEMLLVVVALAAALFVSTATAQEKERKGPRGGPPRPIEMLIEHRQDLGLSDDQVAKLKAVQEANRPQVEALRDLTPEQRREKMEAIMKDSKAKIDAILTPEQQKKVKEMRAKGGKGGKGGKERRGHGDEGHDGPPPPPEGK